MPHAHMMRPSFLEASVCFFCIGGLLLSSILLCVLLALPGLGQPFGQRGVLQGAMYRPATFFPARLFF